jgi:hypothetical protein
VPEIVSVQQMNTNSRMIKKLITLLYFLWIGHSSNYAQTINETRFSIAYTFLNEASATILFPLSEKHQASIDAGIIIPFSGERYYNPGTFDIWTIPIRAVNTYGAFIRPGYRIKNRTDRNSIELKFEYAYLKSGGSNYTHYEEFKDTYQNFTLLLSFEKQFKYDTQFSFFVIAGCRVKYITRQYSYLGEYVNIPSNKKESFVKGVPLLTVGYRLTFE